MQKIILSLFIALLSSSAWAAPSIVYHGRLLNSSSVPVTGSVNFKIQVLSPGAEQCILWEETQTQTLASGVFSLSLNGSSSTRIDAGAHSFVEVFSNRKIFSVGAPSCAPTYSSYTPGSTHARILKVSFNDGSFMGWEEAPDQAINYTPKALDSYSVGGYPASSVMRFAESSGALVSAATFDQADYDELVNLLEGDSTQYLTKSTTEGTALPVLTGNPATLTAGKIWYEAGEIKYYDAVSSTVKTIGSGSVSSSGNNVTSGMLVGTTTNYDLRLITNNSTRMTIDTAGNVGIGTTAPTSQLHTVTTMTPVSGSSHAHHFATTYNPASAPAVTTYANGIYSGLATAGAQDLTGASLTAARSEATHSTSSNISVVSGVNAKAYNNNTGTVAQANGAAGSVSNLVGGTITNAYGINGAITNAGSGNITSGIASYANVSNTGTGTISSGYGFYASPPVNSGGGGLTSYYGLYIATPTAATNNYGVYSQGGTNYFGGNVGIGTTAPTQKLDVAGIAKAWNYYAGAGAANDPAFATNSAGIFAPSAGVLGFSTSSTEKMRITSAGNVGIGTTAPTALFHVAGGGSPGKLMVLGDAANLNGYIDMMVSRGFVGYSGSTGNTVLQGGGGKGILLNVNNATFGSGTAMAIDSTGKVGVGTTAPGVILDIAGQSTLVRGTGTTPGEIRLGPGPTTGSNYVGFKGPSANPAASVLWQLPSADGTNGQLLTTNGSGVLSWSSVAGAGSSQASSTNFIFNTNSDNSGSDGGVSFQNNGADLMTVSNAGDTTITSAGSSAFSIGPNGATNPTLNIDASTVSAVTGLNITSGAAGSGVTVQATSTGANESLVIRSKGTGSLTLGTNTSGGSGIILQNATSNRLAVGAATYNFTPGPAGATAARFSYTGAADSSMTAGTEANNVYFNLGQTRTHNAGAITLQRDFRITGATHAFGGASTVSDAATFAVDGPPSGGANATLSRSSAIYVPTSTVANTTSSYGLNVTAASGATNNYAAVFMGGNVGIGTTGPTTQLQVAGVISPSADNTHDLGTVALRFKDIYAANNVIQTSDARLKTDIKDSDLGLDFINSLRPVSYYWKEGDSKLHYGVIAQETEKALSEAKKISGRENEVDNVIVTHDNKTDRYGVRYTELIAPMIKAIQELYSEIFGIKNDIDDMRTKTASLESENKKLKQENAAIKAYLCAKDKNASICK